MHLTCRWRDHSEERGGSVVMMFIDRLEGGARTLLPSAVLCDTWLADEQRFGDTLAGLESGRVLGRWPGELETDAAVRLAQAVGNKPTWSSYAQTPPVAQKLAERARQQPLDLEIGRHLQHLQHVCHRPRLHLRIEEERVPVARARRIPVRSVADLVSHPGDWEHRTLRSIQPSRVLAQQVEDEWNLYENRVAARLVDHLLAYVAKRLEELRKIKEILEVGRDHSDKLRETSFRRAERITVLWSSTLESKTEEELRLTIKRLEHAQRDLQALLDAPLYQQIPRQRTIGLSLKPTNILVNDPHYRKVAALWRAWAKFGHKHQETAQQRAERRQHEATSWDQFVFHLVVRGFTALGWSHTQSANGWELTKTGWCPVQVSTDKQSVIHIRGTKTLRLLPICADLAGADPQAIQSHITQLDKLDGEVIVVHVGHPASLIDTDRAFGWSFAERTVLFACSPWSIDSEERMSRVLHGWLSRAAVPIYPATTMLPSLPSWPERLGDWLHYKGTHLVVFKKPTDKDLSEACIWATNKIKALNTQADRAKSAKQAFEIAPLNALSTFQKFIAESAEQLIGLASCPVCEKRGRVEARPGKLADGSDATWWAQCDDCASQWGTRSCTKCSTRYRILVPKIGINDLAALTCDHNWPDKVFGRDLWTQPCKQHPSQYFRCPNCGGCGNGRCTHCTSIDA
jgi:hypothetical protein